MIKQKKLKFYLPVDLFVTAASFLLAYYIRNNQRILPTLSPLIHNVFLFYIILPLWAILLFYFNAYPSRGVKNLLKSIKAVLKTTAVGGFILMSLIFVFKLYFISRMLIGLFLLINGIFLAGSRSSLYIYMHFIYWRDTDFKNVLIVGAGREARAFWEYVSSSHEALGLNIAGFICRKNSDIRPDVPARMMLGFLEDLPEVLIKYPIDDVIFAEQSLWQEHGFRDEAMMRCEELGKKVHILCDFYCPSLFKAKLETYDGWPLLSLVPPPHDVEAFVIKRFMDVALSSFFLFLTAPLFAVVAVITKTISPGPVFFSQERCGLHGRRFNLLKFRTMVTNAEEILGSLEHMNEMSGPVFKIKNDPRITHFGRFLRKYSLDELPQFINVLKGDMSIVGPRPPIPGEVEKYDYWQRRRLSVRPGLTCLWQVNGRNKISFSDWVRLDLEYIDRWSLKLDMLIILKTIPAVLRGTGI